VALFADLLSLPPLALHPLPSLSPQQKKERTLEALIRQLEGLSRQQPVVVVFEDAHWIDPTSRELLDLSVERVHRFPVLLIVTFRPDFQPAWIGHPQVTLLALNRLDRHDRTTLAVQVAGGKALPDEIVAQIVDHTDGVPLFVEELTKSILESGLLREEADCYVLDRASSSPVIPASLHDLLMSRLDRVLSARQIAQVGAAIGRQFPYSLLRNVARLPEDELHIALPHLVASELVFQRGAPPDAVYVFKHALVQDAAHESLLRASRQQLHARIAEALEADYLELVENQPELLAQHYAEAGLVKKSVVYWRKAGRRSAARSAMAEAAAQFQKALDQLALLPESADRRRQELESWNSLGAALRAIKGQAAPETGHAYARARELWELLGSPAEFIGVPWGQSVHYMVRGELDSAVAVDRDMLRLSSRRRDLTGLVFAHHSLGRDLMVIGEFPSSRSHLEEALALYDQVTQGASVPPGGFGSQIGALGYLAHAVFCLGFSDQALARARAALAETRRLAHSPALAVNLAIVVRLHCLVEDDTALDKQSEELVAVATEQGFPYWRAQGNIYCGWVKVQNGDVVKGISLLRSGSSSYRATGAEVWMPHYLCLLANACSIAGQIGEATALLDDALQIVERTGEHWLTAELIRHKGRLLLQQGHTGAAEELYRKALRIAKSQEARLWELRASVALAQLHRPGFPR
jgi:predicted ATPase